jgi:phage/conjugal plasmid C-4 type zinc finger TraR family protein
MDEVDDSQKAERLYRQEALDKRTPVGRPGRESLKICIDCGEAIPEKRRVAIAGCERCCECQEEFYKENGR